MGKIICITSGLTGILNASFELVNRLKADGHELLYAAPKNIGEAVKRQGIPFMELPEIKTQTTPSLPPFKGPFRKLSRWIYKLKHANRLQQEGLKNMEPVAFLNLLKKESPDLLIIDVELHEYILKSYAKDIPMVLLSQWFSLWKRPGLPYLLHDTIPGETWKGQQWAIEFSWKIIRIKRWWTFLKQKLFSVSTDRRSLLLKLAKKANFPLALIKENNWPGPFTYAELPVISMTEEALEFPNQKRPNLFYVGPMVAENRKDIAIDHAINKKLDQIFTLKKNSKLKLIYCSVSTLHQGDQFFIKKLMAAVENRKDWLLVIGMGGLIKASIFEKMPANVFAFSYVPQLKVLKEADCSVNHGGIHTINECLHFQVPMLIYSGKRSDQNGCAARVAYHQLGIMGDKDKEDVKKIQSSIEKILTETKFREQTEKFHQYYLAYKTKKTLENTIHRFLNNSMNHQEKIAI